MLLSKDKTITHHFSSAVEYEWLETNGLGGWSSSTIIGCNTRRYHGLLVAATNPPSERMNLVSKLDETIVTNNERFELGTNNYGDVVHPKGHQYLSSFNKKLFPEFIYEAGGITLIKTVAMIHGENTVVITYTVAKSAGSFTLELLPLLAVRGYHAMMHANNAINREAQFSNDTFKAKAYEGTPDIYIKIPGATYHPEPNWFYNFNYGIEQYRGLDYTEDLFSHGKFSVKLKEGDVLGVILSIDDPTHKDAHKLLLKEEKRKKDLLNAEPFNGAAEQILTLAADQFIVQRNENLKTVIAGYHWFTDWGRDTMISLPGLTLSTGRYEDAKKIIAAFAMSVSMGMLPNRFQDNGDAPEYNNVDGTLWYFIAVYKYLRATNDVTFVLDEVLPVLKDIIDWHFKGTRFNIHVDNNDGMLYAGETGQQLTWMDARIGNWVVTPRMGKAVEIQALWFNALKIYAELCRMNNQHTEASIAETGAEKLKQNFIAKFWYEEGKYLYDVIDENGMPDISLRPNQIFSISLPFVLIDGVKADEVLKIIEEQLYTPVGLRSLPKTDVRYIPVYGGDTWHRDSAYHQGTVWSWLLGPYVDALIKIKGTPAEAKEVISRFIFHLGDACIGSVSEIFDADKPHHPRGCAAQAWGVAEVLRVIKDYSL